MKYELWASEPFLRTYELQEREMRILSILDKYLRYRNIVATETRKAEMVDFIVSEMINIPYLKEYTIRWELNKFTDEKNQNVSAANVMTMIRKAISHEDHKAAIKRWDAEDEKNRLPVMTEAQKQDMKREARLVSWNIVVDIVKSGKQEFNNLNWINAIKHLAFEIGFVPEKMDLDHFHDKAMGTIYKEIESDKNNPSLSREDQKKSLKDSLLIVSKQIQGTDIESRINNLRQRLICEYYIKNNL